MTRVPHASLAFAALVAATLPFFSASTARAGSSAPAWSATTLEAAATDANKRVLAQGKAVTITGEIIDVSCYAQLGKRGDAHVACGTKCIQHGEPIGLVDDKGMVYVLVAEQHHPRRDGELSIRDAYLAQLSKRVTVTGTLSANGGVRTLFVPIEKTDAGTAPSAHASYMCPMDTDVHSPNPGKCPKCGMDLVREGGK